eukprot:scaffold946_cov359-Pavlova_lutheri.AAC.6
MGSWGLVANCFWYIEEHGFIGGKLTRRNKRHLRSTTKSFVVDVGHTVGNWDLQLSSRREDVSSFSLGPLVNNECFCRSPSFGGRACSRCHLRLLRRAEGARSLLVVHRGRHLIEHVDKCLTK